MDYNQVLENSFKKSYSEGLDLWTRDSFLNTHIINYADSLKGNDRKILDIGTGKAQNAHIFLEKGFYFVGIDITQQKVWEFLESKYPGKVKFYHSHFLHWNNEENLFTNVLDVGCLHHQRYEDIPNYLKKVSNILTKDGKYLLIVSAYDDGEENEKMHKVEILPSGKIRNKFNALELKSLLGEDFEVESIKRIHNVERNRFLLEVISKRRV
ncbi:class I SAM-dependent methyltransferase [Bacillus arachidis]|uniref:class I SAM-dependent methyltransferase n=1 Tax=Bacillus arachidis TaxID=2819290 RepID=UPI00255C5D6C|nr:class I SAM-dependent methyltransferase [Bacillus arachidis]WIY58761.1 class I SAM-dependent methyltransferase [Bacillus arachidis]